MSNLDDINLQIMKNKIGFYDHNLNILNDKYKGNQTFDIIMSRFKKYMDCINKLLCQVSITTDKQIKQDLLDTASKMICSNINDLYLIISNILVTNDNKLHRILDGISLKLKNIFNIKTDVIILDGISLFNSNNFSDNSCLLSPYISLNFKFALLINSSLSYFLSLRILRSISPPSMYEFKLLLLRLLSIWSIAYAALTAVCNKSSLFKFCSFICHEV